MFGETASEAWQQRFGEATPGDGETCVPANFLVHRSVREFSNRAIPRQVIQELVGAAQSAATSSNLQLWSVVSIQDPQRREAVAKLAGDQNQIRAASWFLAFLVDLHRVAEAARSVGEDPAALDTAEFFTMGVVDAALAAERMVCAAESIGIGTCYIGALRNDVFGVKELLGLPPLTFGVFGLCLGYPAEGSTATIKPRLSNHTVWFEERYDCQKGIGDFDARAVAFYESQGMNPGVNWSMRSGRRINGTQMTGREAVKPFLTEQGLDLR